MSKHIDYEKENDWRVWHLNATGGAAKDGLTVRDYFAAKAMQGMIKQFDFEVFRQDFMRVAAWSYEVADAMMKARENNDA